MAGRLEGKTALITAAGQGIGHATALAMAREGAHGHRDRRQRRAARRSCTGVANVTRARLDVLDDAAVAALVDELPPLQILFNCAGYVHDGTILDCTPKDWDFSFNLNVRAMYVAIRAALPKMLAQHEATGQRREHHQHGVDRRLDQGPAEPLRLRRDEGRGRSA